MIDFPIIQVEEESTAYHFITGHNASLPAIDESERMVRRYPFFVREQGKNPLVVDPSCLDNNLNDWIDGCRDCRDGIPHEKKSASYDSGYAYQYELEQIRGNA